MLSRVLMGAVFGIIAFLICLLIGSALMLVNLSLALAIGAFLKSVAMIIGFIVFLYYVATGTTPV